MIISPISPMLLMKIYYVIPCHVPLSVYWAHVVPLNVKPFKIVKGLVKYLETVPMSYIVWLGIIAQNLMVPIILFRDYRNTAPKRNVDEAWPDLTPGPLFTKRMDVLPRSRKVSKPRDLGLNFSTESWQATRQQCDHHNIQSRGLKTSRDLTARRPSAQWIEV